ncbi:UbiA family prenyltransferase [Haloarcula nitratireducens]|uniref:UbiA family prenyltransferase n=1 Tax=Haloarcula nitratireducens TaxID=2487749 RepID=A0AAW4PKP6_9EURY|nr:UbiA family prenyltransferase [Halomicroarcula nitratireducens]MBX0298259.1 UbiA family prenyltransferase [Halomicroarcula nitratireducens]
MVEVSIVTELLSLQQTIAPAVAGLLTFSVYVNDRLADLETDILAAPQRTVFVQRYAGVLYILGALAYGLAVALSVLGGPVAFGLTLVPGIVWLSYAQEWIPSVGTEAGRLKDILIINSGLVAAAWSAVIVFLPVAFAGAGLNPAAIIVFCFFTVATFVNTEIPNVRDIDADRAIGVATLPAVVGVTQTRWILYGVTVGAGVILALGVASGNLSSSHAWALSVGLVCLAVVVGLLGRFDSDGTLAFLAECTRLPVFVVLLVQIVAF